ncbi:imm11 family protein [Glacieibacterium frigidum]|uniref:Immunity MXAN-0049 protein domain-containing protein n=1 Tax=Glacieibacterium frigidum TaxID=2593303 RepID=A0A552UGN4_9SPHN|nr:DUF1629 domain-containing protein [Glacieibacterium frigidum]TRW17347.1 hypothetical protein FMM06_04010 [Glacieibacterium frigidum]
MKSVRIIQTPGDGLLPPSAAPLIPADIGEGEIVRVVPPVAPWRPDTIEAIRLRKAPHEFPQFDARYWQLAENNQHPTDTLNAWKNDPGPGQPVVGFGHGLDRVPPLVEYRFKPSPRKLGPPDHWQARGPGLLVLSSRFLDMLLDADPGAVAHRPIEMRGPDVQVFDRDHHLVDIVRVVPAVDYANSVVEYYGPEMHDRERLPARVQAVPSARFRGDLDGDLHIFRHGDPGAGLARGCFVSAALKHRLDRLKPKLRNLQFVPLYEGVY